MVEGSKFSMMDSYVETQRKAHEELERLEDAMVKGLLEKPKAFPPYEWHLTVAKMGFNRKASFCMTHIKMLIISSPEQRREMKKVVKKRIKLKAEVIELENAFSGEESLGRYLDLHEVFDTYINLKGSKKLNYLAYLSEFDKFSNIPPDTRRSPSYLKKYAGMLAAQLEETKSHVERKQALTFKERMVDAEEEVEEELIASDDEEEEKIYNPLKLPLGWDGKPIPYWLYKLHGLGVEYQCEICGNYEWRHAHGMRCLGIPNTRHFHEITLIADAYALWEKLKSQTRAESFKADAMEEFEDAEGNIYDAKDCFDT
ncbi:hypothetical protein HDU67_005808 [Dinochytrium kinnereticum]|nr:hypothetical protein HDU67_005808 [Dinochytrium kinnereticum]